MTAHKNTIVQFTPFSSLVQPEFWHELTRLKVDVLRLAEHSLPISATYAVGRSITDRETGKEVDLGCHITLGGDAFDVDAKPLQHSIRCTGTFKNFNTIEDFRAADKSALFNQVADEIWNAIRDTGDSSVLNRFLLITFADLKKYKYYYWFAFPALVAKPAWSITEPGWQSASDVLGVSILASIHSKLPSNPLPFFLARPSGNEYETAPLSEFSTFFEDIPPSQQLVCFLDPSASPEHPGWPLRNVLAHLRERFLTKGAATVRVLCWRDTEKPRDGVPSRSRFGVVECPASESTERPSAVGWEKNTSGKLGARLADLAPMLDPRQLAAQAVDLNLKLMRWRILPALDLERIAGTRCLLLGAGTLGCYVARVLLGWGVRDITFIDSGVVAFSNPVRQPLFEFEDCLEGGKPKAACAANAVRRIFPGVNAKGIMLSVPMPGHPVPPQSTEQVRQDIAQLETLIAEHDATFLLMDSRESRWLPTVIGKAKGKIVLNAALGFDSYLVMRHGARSSTASTATPNLGCYYCNDVVAPADSLTDRTLDQMCTVTRPGLAAIASASAVELLVSVLQHPAGVHAPAPSPDYLSKDYDDEAAEKSGFKGVLGVVPHQLRGFLAQFRTLPIVGAAYERCTGCSEAVLQAYEKEGFDMFLNAFNDTKYLEKLTGLDKLHIEGEALLEAMEGAEWDDDEGEL
ncbi:ubiquitin-like conjugating enzyme [Fomitiporia mediterranea MF3/22]|uniref:ubiquitin-like conjugating enzyme n=1 Tax=Fomitiporia mediterranea (strain MF3/22) TaxID=694068 RepID=UPI0004409AB3|nr:ubiquitin-like conjugating enzyme [Fomitiporia mediterranea MF3/22]EJD01962.1 ubiquitin-like conjugating enzyme [Fomitiporia mediterranea MF3/22]